MSNKKVSIITTTYNCVSKNVKTYFYEMFRSIHEQNYPYIEHVIVDGGSKDGSVEFIKNLIEKYGKKEILFISEPDKGTNDATNKGYRAATGDYITLMCDDDFYTRPDAISKLMNEIENGADYAYCDTWWLNQSIWVGEEITFAWRQPFLINALIFRKDLLHGEDYLDLKYPMVGDYDFFMRLLKQENIKGGKVHEVLTVLRPGGYSQSSENKYTTEIEEILAKHFDSKYLKGKELYKRLHNHRMNLRLLLKIKLFCKNKKIRDSVFDTYTKKRVQKIIINRITLSFLFKWFKPKKNKISHESQIAPKIYSTADSRIWIETFYNDLYNGNNVKKIYVFDMDGTLTPARLPMTEEFKGKFLPWLKTHTAFIATGSDIKKVHEQLDDEVINEFDGIYCSMGNTLYQKDELLYKKEIEYNEEMLSDLEDFRKNTKYPYQLFGNYIEKRIGMINFSVIGRDCTYEERTRYSEWDKENGERLAIQKFMQEKYPDYDFECGGNISLDIIPKGCGKGQIAHHLRDKFPNEKIIFLGDRTFEGGNDYALAHELSLMDNTKVVQVNVPDEVLDFLLKGDN